MSCGEINVSYTGLSEFNFNAGGKTGCWGGNVTCDGDLCTCDYDDGNIGLNIGGNADRIIISCNRGDLRGTNEGNKRKREPTKGGLIKRSRNALLILSLKPRCIMPI